MKWISTQPIKPKIVSEIPMPASMIIVSVLLGGNGSRAMFLSPVRRMFRTHMVLQAGFFHEPTASTAFDLLGLGARPLAVAQA
jgi:hypothetical protein